MEKFHFNDVKIIEDLRKSEEYLLEACHSKHDKTLCEALLDLDRCRLFLEMEFHEGESFHTYSIGSFGRESYRPKTIFSYEDVAERINYVLDKVKDGDKKITVMLENIITLWGKNLLCL